MSTPIPLPMKVASRKIFYIDKEMVQHTGLLSILIPEKEEEDCWKCVLELKINEFRLDVAIFGGDSIQSLELAIKFIPSFYIKMAGKHGIEINEFGYDE
jgi:hypothetical protein